MRNETKTTNKGSETMTTNETVSVPVSVLEETIAWLDDAKLAQTNPESQRKVYDVQSAIQAALQSA